MTLGKVGIISGKIYKVAIHYKLSYPTQILPIFIEEVLRDTPHPLMSRKNGIYDSRKIDQVFSSIGFQKYLNAPNDISWLSPKIQKWNNCKVRQNNVISAKYYHEKGVRFRTFELAVTYYNTNK